MKKYLFVLLIVFSSSSFAIDVPTVDDYQNKINKSNEIEKDLIIDNEKQEEGLVSSSEEDGIKATRDLLIKIGQSI